MSTLLSNPFVCCECGKTPNLRRFEIESKGFQTYCDKCYYHTRPYDPFKSPASIPNPIGDNLYIGDVYSTDDQELLLQLKIRKIFVAGRGLTMNYVNDSRFLYYYLDIQDEENENISCHFEKFIDFVDNKLPEDGKESATLVHCGAGVSRSGTLVVAYLMFKNNWPLKQALEFAQSKRNLIQPNQGFMKQLEEYEKQLQHSNGQK